MTGGFKKLKQNLPPLLRERGQATLPNLFYSYAAELTKAFSPVKECAATQGK